MERHCPQSESYCNCSMHCYVEHPSALGKRAARGLFLLDWQERFHIVRFPDCHHRQGAPDLWLAELTRQLAALLKEDLATVIRAFPQSHHFHYTAQALATHKEQLAALGLPETAFASVRWHFWDRQAQLSLALT